MNRKDLITALKKEGGSAFITIEQLKNCFGISDNRYVKPYLQGLGAINGKYYLITEVADNIIRREKFQ